MRFRTSRKSRDFFMPHVDPFDLAIAPHRVRQAVQAVAYNAIDPFDTCCNKDIDKLIRN
jgi:hypothetical protein